MFSFFFKMNSLRGLRLAFFGSDRFSILSLRALLDLKERKPDIISSIDVITRQIKPQGRKKLLIDLPVGEFATANNVNVLRADTKSEILDVLRDRKFDLTVAVSYGKLIPRDFVEAMTYGGLNVHPSLLPRYSGSSPMQYALMNDDPATGVTVQTLHPTKFDHGDLLAQSEEIKIEESDNYATLEQKLGTIGGQLLVDVIENSKFTGETIIAPKCEYSSAFKIDPSMSQVHWNLTSRQIKRRFDALGPLYAYISCNTRDSNSPVLKRVLLNDICESNDECSGEVGSFSLNDGVVKVKTIDSAINVSKLTFECCSLEDANTFVKRLKKRTKGAQQILT